MKHTFQIVLLMVVCFSCKQADIFDLSPAERTAKQIRELKQELVSAPHGWSVTYFSKTDSLLFTNVNELMTLPKFIFEDVYKFGYGGHSFLMKFADNGIVEMVADYNRESLAKSKQSEFEVNQNTFTQLSFTTHNYLHALVNDQFSGSSDFLYTGKDIDGNLLFKTTSYTEPAREYIVFTKLKSEESRTENIKKAYENRLFFEEMKNPQIKIHKAGRVYFRSDRHMRTYIPGIINQRPEIYKRYHLFLSTAYFAPQGWTEKIATGLGSGYVGTAEGLTLKPGIRYDKTYIFYDFKREGNKFVCELVRVFDPYTKTYRLVSKHLAPNGEEIGIIAEIWDEN